MPQRWNCPCTVSYTHLDVYKRQIQEALAGVDVELADHISVADDDFVSVADSGFLEKRLR